MVVYTVRCVECDETRVARETETGIRPVRERCPECDSPEYEVLARDSED